MNNIDIAMTVLIGTFVATFLLNTRRVLQALVLCKECLFFLNNKALEKEKNFVESAQTGMYIIIFKAYCFLNDHTSGIECGKKLLDFLRRRGKRVEEGRVTLQLAKLYQLQSKYKEAKGLYEEALSIMIGTGQRQGEGSCYVNLGIIYRSLSEYGKAEEYLKKALAITQKIGDEKGEASCYGNLGDVYHSLCEYRKAEEYLKKALAITQKIGDEKGKASCYGNLGTVYQSLGEYGNAETYQSRALVIRNEIGDKEGEAACYANLGTVYAFQGKYSKAIESHKKALAINEEIGDKNGEETCYGNLGQVHKSLGKHGEAEEKRKKVLVMRREIGSRKAEASSYGNLGSVYRCRGEYGKAEEYLKKALTINEEIGNKEDEAAGCANLGIVYHSMGKYDMAEKYYNKALVITKEIGKRDGEATIYESLAVLYQSLGNNCKTEEYHNKALVIRKEIGDRKGEATSYGNLGNVYTLRGEYDKAKEHIKKALAIAIGINYRNGEATCYCNLGTVYCSLGKYQKAEKYQKKALLIREEIGDRQGQASSYGALGTLFRSLGKHAEAKQYHEKALTMSSAISDLDAEAKWHLQLAYDAMFSETNVGSQDDIVWNLFGNIINCEKMRTFLGHNDQFKISLLDKHWFSYHLLSAMFCVSGNATEALCILEHGRARALADLISGQYSAQQQVSVSPLSSWADIERVVKKEINCSCLYISFSSEYMFLWLLQGNKPMIFRQINVNECFVDKGLERDADEVFSEKSFRRFHVLPEEHCEDRSLSFSKAGVSTPKPSEKESLAAFRLVEDEEEENLQPVPTLTECYQMIIVPVADSLDEPELMIVPDRALYKVPFAALKDESNKYLSESYRIRIVPSLTTLRLIQDRPADYHSQTGALIVGDPDVGNVLYKGRIENLCRLPSAGKEAEMIGELLNAEPLLGKQATKKAVLQSIHSVSLIHFAAHGEAERGEIALAPGSSTDAIPSEEDYLLTMADISRVQLRANLVVLSCCHSAQGHVRAEGVVGIARAFLGSGARSVLAALWAIPDEATEQLMSRFYEHLVRGESASESLHQAMKWMRNNGYADVEKWASFMLIGDNVTFDFGK